MTDKEKLVELIGDLYGVDPMYYGVDALAIADHLIANGVTIQRWVSVEERLPEHNTIVLVFVRGYIDIGWYDGNHDEWRTGIATLDKGITHWMPLPEPPKEEV